MTRIPIYVTILFICLTTTSLVDAGLRCSIGEWSCVLSCKVQLKKTGLCDNDGECRCSEISMTLDDFKSELPSRCDLGLQFCKSTCNAIGRMDGTCSSSGCDCSDETLSASQLALCSTDTACRVYCQSKGKATGDCNGWNCVCSSGNLQEF